MNGKTILRTILGNAAIMPANLVSDFIGAGVDKAIATKTGVRTTGMSSMESFGKDLAKGAYESFDDFRRGINTRNIDSNRFEIGDTSVFKPNLAKHAASKKILKALNALDRTTSFLLDVGDRPFFEGYFTSFINQQMKLNGVKEPTPNMIQIATDQALKRTWQDNNAFTRSVNTIRSIFNGNKKFGLGSIMIPFTKTPANLTKALVDYSPVGVVKVLTLDAVALKRAMETGKATAMMQRKFVGNLSKGVTGSMLMLLWAYLSDHGHLSGAADEDKDVRNFERNVLGIQPYSVTLHGASPDVPRLYGGTEKGVISGLRCVIKGMVNGSF